mgnify:CR=1 FL=1
MMHQGTALLASQPTQPSNGHLEPAPASTPAPAKLVSTRRVLVSGFAETTRDVANRQPKEVEIWALNRCYSFLKRWDRWYELHEPELYTGQSGLRETDYLEVLKKSKGPVFMLNPWAELPMARQYPYQEICERFRDYFTNSIGYMLAHAAYEHVTGNPIGEVLVCGVDMSAYSEYNEQRPCVEYWLGVLDGLGVKVTIPAASPLLKAAQTYGRRNRAVLWGQAKERLAHHKTRQKELEAQVNAAVGIVGDADQCLKAVEKGASAVEWIKARRKEVIGLQAQITAELNAEIGGMREAQHWLTVVNAPQSAEEEPESAKIVR